MKLIAYDMLDEIPYPVTQSIAYEPTRSIINHFNDAILTIFEESDKENLYIYCTGSSGSFLSAILSVAFYQRFDNKGKDYKITINHIKKDGEKAHKTSLNVTTYEAAEAFNVIVDDFIASGRTIENIMNGIDRHFTSSSSGPMIDLLAITGFVSYGSIDIFNDRIYSCLARNYGGISNDCELIEYDVWQKRKGLCPSKRKMQVL